MPTKISEVLSKFIQTANNAAKIKGLLGTGENVSDPFTVPGKPDYMWVRIFRGSSQTLESALNSGVPRIHNLPVILELTDGGYYKIIGPDYSDVQAVGDGTPGLTVAPHTHDLSHGNADMVESMRIMQGHFEIVEGLTIAINDINNFYWNSTPSYFFRGTYDLTDNRPSTSGKWRWVKIGINASTKLIEVANGTDKDQTTVLSIADLNAISFSSSDVMPCFGVKLKQGQTAIQRVSDVADIRPWLSGINSSVVSAINNDGFITKTPSSNLSNEFALSTLATGLLKNTTTTGVPTIAVEGTDYLGIGSVTTEYIQDLIDAFLVEGSNISLTYNDVANTLTVGVSGLTSANISDFTEAVQDVVGAFSQDGTNIDVVYDDTANTYTINITGQIPIANGGTGSNTAAGARTNLGLGTIATQDANNVNIDGGTIDSTPIGGTTPAAGTFTTAIFDMLKMSSAQAATLSSNAFSLTKSYAILTSESGTSDDLETINGGSGNTILMIQAAALHTITVKNSTGNIFLNSGADFTLSGDKTLLLFYDGTNWSDGTAGGGGAPTTAKYLLQQADGSLPNAQDMSALATGIVKNTTTTGVQSIAAAGTDYTSPTGTENLSNKTITASSLIATALSLLIGGFRAIFTHAFTADRTVTIPGDADVTLVGVATAQTLTNKTLTTPTIGDFTNATHDHTNAAGGGQITDAALSAAVSIAKGGTGQTSKTPAFDALAPGTTKGDIIVYDGSDNVRKAVGSDGRILKADSSQSDGLSYVDDTGRAFANLCLNSQFERYSRSSADPGGVGNFADDTYGLDQWIILTQTGNAGFVRNTVNSGTNPGTSAVYSGQLAQPNVTAQRIGLLQILENSISQPQRGKSMRFQIKVCPLTNAQDIRVAILEWTGAADVVTSDVVNDWTSTTYTPGNFFKTTSMAVVGVSNAVNCTADEFTSVSVTGTVSNSCTNLMIFVWSEDTLSQGQVLRLTEVWFGNGSDEQVWLPPDPAVDGYRCERFLKVFWSGTANQQVGFGLCVSTSSARINIDRLHMRAVPSLVATAGDWVLNSGAASTDLTSISITSISTEQTVSLTADTAGGLTQFRPTRLLGDGAADRYLILSAEL